MISFPTFLNLGHYRTIYIQLKYIEKYRRNDVLEYNYSLLFHPFSSSSSTSFLLLFPLPAESLIVTILLISYQNFFLFFLFFELPSFSIFFSVLLPFFFPPSISNSITALRSQHSSHPFLSLFPTKPIFFLLLSVALQSYLRSPLPSNL